MSLITEGKGKGISAQSDGSANRQYEAGNLIGNSQSIFCSLHRHRQLTVSIQQSPPLGEVVDKGLEKVQEKNNVGQKLHNSTAFHGWVDKNAAWSTDI